MNFPWQVIKLITESAVSNGITYQDIPGKFYELLVTKRGVTHVEIERFMAALEKITGRTDLSLAFAKSFIPESVDDYLTLAFTAKNLGHAVELLSKYKWLLHPSIDLSIAYEGDLAMISYQSTDGFPILEKPFYAEGMFSCMYFRTRDVTGVDFYPERIHFRHPRPKHFERYQDYFGCPVFHDCDVDTMVLKRPIVDLPYHTHDPIASFELQKASDLKLQDQDPFLATVSEIVSRHLACDEYSLESLALEMGMSKRSLQRKLRLNGLTFSQLRNSLRIRRAVCCLQQHSMNSEAIAQALGFLNGHSFRQFFKKHTGRSISEYRQVGSTTH